MKKGQHNFILILLFAAAAFLIAPSAYAQEKEKTAAKAEFTLEEVVVTAERRETTAQDTPVAVSAWDAAQIDEQNIAGNADLQIRMPSTFVNGDSVTIRGVGYRSAYLGSDVGVGIFNDGFFNPHSSSAFSDLFDVERIESVRGPQSTLYGKSTEGGAINIIETRPTKEWSGQLKASIGNYERRNFQAAFGGPAPVMNDKLFYRIILEDIWFGGDQKAVFLGTDQYVDTKDRWRVNAKLLYEPTENLSFYLRYDLHNSDERPYYSVLGTSWVQTRSLDPLIPSLNDDFISYYSWLNDPYSGNFFRGPWYHLVQTYGENPSLADPQKVAVSDAGITSLNDVTVDLTATLTLGDFTVKYLTMYRAWTTFTFTDYDLGPNPDAKKLLHTHYADHDWSQELQALYGSKESRLNALAGLYYSFLNRDDEWELRFVGPWYWEFKFPYTYSYGLTVTPHSDGLIYGLYPGLEDINEAAYAKVDYDITKTLTLSLGGRYAIDRKKGYEWIYYFLMYPGYPGYNINPLAAAAGYTHGQDLTPFGYPGKFGYIDDDGTPVYLVPGQYLRDGYPYEYYTRANSYKTHKEDWDQWLFHVGLDWKPNDDMLIYGKIDKGYKPGGFPLGAFQKEGFNAETIISYEIGWKQLWLGGRFSTILDGFYYDYEDMQVSQVVSNDVLVVNAGKAHNDGIELETTGYLIENLLGSVSYSWNIAEYDEFKNAYDQFQPNKGVYDPVSGRYVQDLSGNTEPYTPEHKITVNLTYTLSTGIGDFAFHGLYFWQSEIYTSQFNIPENLADAYDRVDADISWNSPGYKWRVTLWSKNLTDEDILVDQFHAGPADYFTSVVSYYPPRMFGVDVSFKW